MDQHVSTTPPVDWLCTPGLTDYTAGVATMQSRAAAIHAGCATEQVWLVEHPRLYTAGSSARDPDLIGYDGIPVHRTGRGGQWTYHGPGQRVAYVMLDLRRDHGSVPPRDVRHFVAGLETWLIDALAIMNVQGQRRPGRVGVWVADPKTGSDQKIAAIGVRVSHWITTHGIALNVTPDLSDYSGIVPCGLRDHGVTSLAALGVNMTMTHVDAVLRTSFERVFGVRTR